MSTKYSIRFYKDKEVPIKNKKLLSAANRAQKSKGRIVY